MILRSYQKEFVAGILAEWQKGHRRVAGVMATGGGKTPTAMHVAEMSLRQGLPVLWIAHRRELVDQAIDKAEQVAPGRRIGRLQGREKQFRADIVIGSVQTASTAGALSLLSARRWGLIVVDETHHIVAPTYLRVLDRLGAMAPDGPLTLGITATLDRSDGMALGQVFESVAEPRIGLIDLIRQGFLVRPRGIRVRIAELDLARVRRTAGDLNAGQLGAAMQAAMAPQRIVEAWEEHARGRPTIAFLPTVEISRQQAAAFREAGHRAVHLDGETPDDVRALELKRFREGEVDILCNVGLFTEGTDLPSVGCVVLGRPTSSASLYQQMVGRGLRLHPGKKDCVILDVTGVTGRHKLATLASLTGADVPEDIPDDLLLYEENLAGEDDADGSDVDEDKEPVPHADGDTVHELIDLFEQSHSAWLRTRGGTWFLTAGHAGFIYLDELPDDRYRVKWIGHDRTSGEIRSDMEIGYAMAAGDEVVAANPIWQADRDAPWRAQRVRGGRTRGEVHDEKMIAQASALIDPR